MRAILLTVFLCVFVKGHRFGGSQNQPAFLKNVTDQAWQSYYTIVKNKTSTTAEKQSSLINWASYYGVQNFDVNTALTSNTVRGFRGLKSSEEGGRSNGRGGRRSTTRSPFGANSGFGGFNNGFGSVGNGAFPGFSGNQFGQESDLGSSGQNSKFGQGFGQGSGFGSSQFSSGQGFGQGSVFGSSGSIGQGSPFGGRFGNNQAPSFGSQFGQNAGQFEKK